MAAREWRPGDGRSGLGGSLGVAYFHGLRSPGRHEPPDGPEVAETAGHDEKVPQLVEAEAPGRKAGPLEAVEEGPNQVEEAADPDPQEGPGRQHLPQQWEQRKHQVAEGHVQQHREPPRGIKPEDLRDDAGRRDRPHQGKQAPSPRAPKRPQEDGAVRAGDEHVDHGVIDALQNGRPPS